MHTCVEVVDGCIVQITVCFVAVNKCHHAMTTGLINKKIARHLVNQIFESNGTESYIVILHSNGDIFICVCKNGRVTACIYRMYFPIRKQVA